MKTENDLKAKQREQYLKELERVGRAPVEKAYTFSVGRNATPEKKKKD